MSRANRTCAGIRNTLPINWRRPTHPCARRAKRARVTSQAIVSPQESKNDVPQSVAAISRIGSLSPRIALTNARNATIQAMQARYFESVDIFCMPATLPPPLPSRKLSRAQPGRPQPCRFRLNRTQGCGSQSNPFLRCSRSPIRLAAETNSRCLSGPRRLRPPRPRFGPSP